MPIGQWVMQTACSTMAPLHAECGIYIAVNISVRQLIGDLFAGWVEDVLAHTGLAPEALVVEVTESAVMDDIGLARSAFHRLRAQGVKVSIDDFGTGYSSLARLQRLPVDVIKLDRAFVTNLDKRPEARAMAAAILQVSRRDRRTDRRRRYRDRGRGGSPRRHRVHGCAGIPFRATDADRIVACLPGCRRRVGPRTFDRRVTGLAYGFRSATIAASRTLPTDEHADPGGHDHRGIPGDHVVRDRDITSHVVWMADASLSVTTAQHSGVGTAFDCRTQIGPIRLVDAMSITQWVPGESMGVEHRGVVRGSGVFTLRRIGDRRTRFLWEERLTFPWWLGGPLGQVFGRPVLTRIWRGNLTRLKRMVEGTSALG